MAALALVAAACSSTPIVPTATFVPSEDTGSEAAASLPAPTPTPTPAVATATPPPSGTTGGGPTGSEPGSSVQPEITAFTIVHTASCTSTNGTSTIGEIHLTWTAVGTTGVRLSIDPPSADVAYDYGFQDYPASGSADVPFSCGAPNHDSTGAYHLYVLTTIHDKGYAMYRYAKVYEVTPTAS